MCHNGGMMNATFGTKIPHIEIHIGMRLAAARQSAELTQEQMGEAVGVTRRTVSRWENGGEKVPLAATLAYAMLTDVNLGWIQTGVAGMASADYAGIKAGDNEESPAADAAGDSDVVRPKGFEPLTFWSVVSRLMITAEESRHYAELSALMPSPTCAK